MLRGVREWRACGMVCLPYSKANANSGTGGGAALVWKPRAVQVQGRNMDGDGDVNDVCREAILEICRNDGNEAMMAVVVGPSCLGGPQLRLPELRCAGLGGHPTITSRNSTSRNPDSTHTKDEVEACACV